MVSLLSCLALAAVGIGCSSSVTVATFNIRLFPEPGTDRERVAETIAALDASVIALQEIRDAVAMGQVLEDVSRRTGRDYQLLLGPCGGLGQHLTTAVAYDAARWSVVEHEVYPDLQPDGVCVRQPGTLAVLQDERDHRLGVLSVHLQPFPDGFDQRQEQWARVLQRVAEVEQRHAGAPVLALGDYNSTGFRGEPQDERSFVEDAVESAGHVLPTADLACTEYWRPDGPQGTHQPSVLDHIVAAGGRWEAAEVRGMCARLGCRPTEADEMDPDFFGVSDHCPVVLRGTL